jgi:hypothetical protein
MRRVLAIVLPLAALLAAAPAAGAATLSTALRCYQAAQTQDIVVKGAGFAPGAVSITRDGKPFGTANADAAGNFAVKFPAEELGRLDRERLFALSATDGALTTAITRYRTSKIFADFSPDEGDPQKLQVRFSINGFGLLRKRASVYLHYIAPSGKARRTVRLGTARGTCGKIRETRLRHLFPFAAERGRWILQFDTNKTYTRATSTSKYIWVRKPVEVFGK